MVLFTLEIGLIRIDLDRTSLVVSFGPVCINSGCVYTACWIEPIRSGSIQKPSVNELLFSTFETMHIANVVLLINTHMDTQTAMHAPFLSSQHWNLSLPRTQQTYWYIQETIHVYMSKVENTGFHLLQQKATKTFCLQSKNFFLQSKVPRYFYQRTGTGTTARTGVTTRAATESSTANYTYTTPEWLHTVGAVNLVLGCSRDTLNAERDGKCQYLITRDVMSVSTMLVVSEIW